MVVYLELGASNKYVSHSKPADQTSQLWSVCRNLSLKKR
jgi:hypothetical protein